LGEGKYGAREMTPAELNDFEKAGSAPSLGIPLSVIIPTRDEERTLGQTLAGVVNWANQIFVFDSFSSDRTLEIAREFGVSVAQRAFDNFAAHKNWALDNLPIRNRWILLLDADERLTPELRDEIAATIANESSGNGYYVARKNYFMGQWIRHAGMYPDWQLRLLQHGKGRYEERIVHEHIVVDGATGYLKNPLEHNDFKGLDRWFDRHNHYTRMEAIEVRRVLEGNPSRRMRANLRSRGPERTRVIKEFAYRYLPCRAFMVFIWMYFIRGGFLDGRVGARYCILRALVDYQISLKLIEMRSESIAEPEKERVQMAATDDTSIVSGSSGSAVVK
jgi:glycosyltransferase involved in cell wall biosynthesis